MEKETKLYRVTRVRRAYGQAYTLVEADSHEAAQALAAQLPEDHQWDYCIPDADQFLAEEIAD